MSEASGLLLHQTGDGRTRVECRFVDDTLRLSQALMDGLFQVTVATINEHLKAIFADGEPQPPATVRKLRTVRQGFALDGNGRRKTDKWGGNAA